MAFAFKDMNAIQRANCLAWALSHDWGSKAAHWHELHPDSELVVYGAESTMTEHADGPAVFVDVRASFTNMHDLRDWAGY